MDTKPDIDVPKCWKLGELIPEKINRHKPSQFPEFRRQGRKLIETKIKSTQILEVSNLGWNRYEVISPEAQFLEFMKFANRWRNRSKSAPLNFQLPEVAEASNFCRKVADRLVHDHKLISLRLIGIGDERRYVWTFSHCTPQIR